VRLPLLTGASVIMLSMAALLAATTAYTTTALHAAAPVVHWPRHLRCSRYQEQQQRRPAVRMQHEGEVDEDSSDAPEVVLLEPGTGRELPCFMAASLEYEGETYGALYPVHVPVTLAQEMQNGRLVPLDEDRMTPELVAACVKACASKDIELLETPVVMTARGSGLELIEDESLRMLEYSDDDGDDDDDSEEALVLAELKHDKLSVLVLQTLEPLYVVGKLLEEDTFEVPTDEELDAVQDTIEQLVVEFEEGFDDEDDDLLDGIEDDEDYRP